ncbi:MAG: hypothetical protein KDA93_22060 [Planctomycetaceae bacterium]|nr:hypothetical protein [Planctomycetaceae bacterium]
MTYVISFDSPVSQALLLLESDFYTGMSQHRRLCQLDNDTPTTDPNHASVGFPLMTEGYHYKRFVKSHLQS